jgi:hypothetical protein
MYVRASKKKIGVIFCFLHIEHVAIFKVKEDAGTTLYIQCFGGLTFVVIYQVICIQGLYKRYMLKKITFIAAIASTISVGGMVPSSSEAVAYAESTFDSTFSVFEMQDGQKVKEKQTIVGEPVATEEQMLAFARSVNPHFPEYLPKLYLEIGRKYGIRGDIAFCQMLKETGYHRFGGVVRASQYNYAGIGAVGNSKKNKGNSFQSPEQGVRAHIQHLYAYATKKPLPADEKVVDPRFKYVTRGIAPAWQDLNGRWAVPGKGYGEEILNLYSRMIQTLVASE